jgi:hypothetical protein
VNEHHISMIAKRREQSNKPFASMHSFPEETYVTVAGVGMEAVCAIIKSMVVCISLLAQTI